MAVALFAADEINAAGHAPAAGVRVEITQGDTIPPRLAGAWSDLAAAAAEPNSFAEPWFIAASLRHFCSEAPPRLLQVWEGQLLLGVMPLEIADTYGRLPLRFVQNWRHDQSFLGTPLVRAGAERAFWTAALRALDQARWAPGLFHLRAVVENGPVHRGLADAARDLGRGCAVVHRLQRALLDSDLSPRDYYERHVRKKKRKEIARLRNRLGELGPIRASVLADARDLPDWCETFLALEKAGWKGSNGSALGCEAHKAAFFRAALDEAWAAGRLQFRRLDVGERPLAMLVNFLAPPGSFSFKTAFDEEFARFSPGVLLQLENLDVLERRDIAWMDSCAAEDHPMIDSLWAERRTLVRVTVRLAGLRRGLIFALARSVEKAGEATRALRNREVERNPG